MYIGPWQEYNLSKTRRAPQNNNGSLQQGTSLRNLAASLQQTIPAEQLRHGLEDALLHTLDPATAQAAMQVMENYFQQQQSASTANVMLASTAGSLNATLPPIHHYTVINNNHGDIITTTTTSIGEPMPANSSRRYQQYQQKSSTQRGRGKGNQTKLSLPPLPQQAAATGVGGGMIYQAPHRHSARDRMHTPDLEMHNYGKSPLSVRSTKSEPLKLPSLAVNAAPLNTYGGGAYFNSGAYSVGGASNNYANAQLLQSTGHFILPLTEKNLTQAQQQMQHTQQQSEQQQHASRTRQQLNVPSSSGSGGSNGGGKRLKQPLYDANAVVNFLRMDRNNQKAKQHINQLAGWNKQSDTDSKKSGVSGGGIQGSKDKAFLENKEKKLEQVNHMKELYLAKNEVNEAERQRLIAQVGIAALEMQKSPKGGKAPIESLSPIHSPRVNDIEITEEQLLQISKYFKQLNAAKEDADKAAISSKATITSTSLGADSPSATSTVGQSPRRKQRLVALDDEIEEDIPPPSYAQAQKGQPVIEEANEVEEDLDDGLGDDDLDLSQFRYVAPKEGYSSKQNAFDVGAADSLLNWSKQLNFDDF